MIDVCMHMQETLWKKLQRSLGLERHNSASAPSPSMSHSSQPDLQQQTPLTRRFLLETSSSLPPPIGASAIAPGPAPTQAVAASRSTFDGWRSRDTHLSMTSRCRSLPGRMHDSASQGFDGWERSSVNYRQTRGGRLRNDGSAAAAPQRVRRTHYHHHHQHQPVQPQQAQGQSRSGAYTPSYVTPSAHLSLPGTHRSRAHTTSGKAYAVTSQDGGHHAVGRSQSSSQQRHVSPSHFSWPGASFDLQAGLMADDDEGRSSAGTQGAGEPTSPSLPSSTSTATNACTRLAPPLQPCDVTSGNDDITPSNDDADTEIADVTAAASAENGDVINSDDTKSEEPVVVRRRRRSCEFNLLDDDDWREDDEWAWPGATTPTTATTTASAETTPAAAVDDDDDDDDDDEANGIAVTQTAINATVMKCIESCDKVLLRHSTAIR